METLYVVLARLEGFHLETMKVNFQSLQPKTYEKFRKELESIKEDLRKAIKDVSAPTRPKKDIGVPLRAEAK